MQRALLAHDKHPLDVHLVHFREVPKEGPLIRLEASRDPADQGEEDDAEETHRLPTRGSDEASWPVARRSTVVNLAEVSKLPKDDVDESKAALWRRAFESFDANGDGCVDRTEFTRFLQRIDDDFFTLDVIDKLLKEADADGDGQIYYYEFVQWLSYEDEDIVNQLANG